MPTTAVEAQKLKQQGGNLFDPIEITKDSLDDPDVVDAVLRSFATVVAGAWKTWVESGGEVNPASAIDDAAKAYAAKFMGGDASLATTTWHTPDRLGRYLAATFTTPVPASEAAQTALLTLADRLLEAQKAFSQDAATADQTEFEINAALEDTGRLMLGAFVPESDPDDAAA